GRSVAALGRGSRNPAERGELVRALLRADRDDAVAGPEDEPSPRTVDPSPPSLHGEDEHTGLGLEPELGERTTLRLRAALHEDLRADLLGLLQGHLHDRVELLAVLHVPGHVAGGIADRLARRGDPEQAPQVVGVAGL